MNVKDKKSAVKRESSLKGNRAYCILNFVNIFSIKRMNEYE